MPNTNETNNAGIRWLSVFEQVATALIIAAVLGIGALLYSTQTLNQSFNNMADQFKNFETKTDKRIGYMELEVDQLKVDMAKVKTTLGVE